MNTQELIEYFNSNGYKTECSTMINDKIGKIHLINSIKGKLFKTKMLTFVLDSFNQKHLNDLIEMVKTINKRNDLCVVLCNTTENLNSKTMFMSDNSSGVCIIHFVYYNTINKSYIYDLDFYYDQSKNVKKFISYIIKRNEPFELTSYNT